jgi:hypothetical protein
MLESLANVDWKSMGAPEIPGFLLAAVSQNEAERTTALADLSQYLVPWELMEGYACESDWQHLDKLINNRLPDLAIPFLIEVLKQSNRPNDKVELLGILYDLCRYAKLPDLYGGPPKSEENRNLQSWGMNLRQLTFAGIDLFRTLLFDEEPHVRLAANELLGILGDEYFIEAWSTFISRQISP